MKTVVCAITIIFAQANFASDIGKIWPSEKHTWIDPEFGHEITQWTDHQANSWHLYFNIETFIDNDHAIIVSERTGSPNFFKLNLQTGEMIQMTDEANLSSHIWHWQHWQTIWYIRDSTQVKSLNTQTLESRTIKNLDSYPRSFTVTCDAKYIVYSCDIGAKPGDVRPRINLGPYAIFKLNIESSEITQISPQYGFVIGHLLASPTDPTRISYCWQHLYREGNYPGITGDTPQRIWWIAIDGTAGGPVGNQEFGLHRTHEFWFPDGGRMGYSARYKFGPRRGEQFLGSCKSDGSDNFMMPAPIAFAHSMIYQDEKHWVVDIYDGMVLTLLTVEDRQIKKVTPLFRHDSSWQVQSSHPHPHFSPDWKMIMFSTDKTGTANVYTVKVDLKPGQPN